MDRATFTELAKTASQRVLGSDEGNVTAVPDIRFRVQLNCSYDDVAEDPRFTLYEDEPSSQDGLSFDEFIELLWRNDRVPAWIDLHKIEDRPGGNRIEARCAGRFAEAEPELYNPGGKFPVFNFRQLWHQHEVTRDPS